MSSEIRIGEPSRCLSPFLFDAWLAFLRAKWDMKATIGDDRELAVGGNGLLSGAREYRAPKRCSKYPILSFSEDSLQAESKRSRHSFGDSRGSRKCAFEPDFCSAGVLAI